MSEDGITVMRGFIPQTTKRGRPDLSGRLSDLEVGDSMFVPCEPGKKWVHVQVNRYVGQTGDNMRCRRGVHEGVEGVWVMHQPDA